MQVSHVENTNHIVFGVLTQDHEIKLAQKGWKPSFVVMQGMTLPFSYPFLSMVLSLEAADKQKSADEQEAWGIVTQCLAHMNQGKCFVLFDQSGALVGACGYNIFNQGVSSLNALCVSKEFRRRGIGRKMFELFCNKLTLPETQHVMISVNDTNTEAIPFWENVPGVCRTGTPPAILAPVIAMAALLSPTKKGRIYWFTK